MNELIAFLIFYAVIVTIMLIGQFKVVDAYHVAIEEADAMGEPVAPRVKTVDNYYHPFEVFDAEA